MERRKDIVKRSIEFIENLPRGRVTIEIPQPLCPDPDCACPHMQLSSVDFIAHTQHCQHWYCHGCGERWEYFISLGRVENSEHKKIRVKESGELYQKVLDDKLSLDEYFAQLPKLDKKHGFPGWDN